MTIRLSCPHRLLSAVLVFLFLSSITVAQRNPANNTSNLGSADSIDNFLNTTANPSQCFELVNSTYCDGFSRTGSLLLPKDIGSILRTLGLSQIPASDKTFLDSTNYSSIQNTSQFDQMFAETVIQRRSLFLKNLTDGQCTYDDAPIKGFSTYMCKFIAWQDTTCEGRTSKVFPVCNSDMTNLFDVLSTMASNGTCAGDIARAKSTPQKLVVTLNNASSFWKSLPKTFWDGDTDKIECVQAELSDVNFCGFGNQKDACDKGCNAANLKCGLGGTTVIAIVAGIIGGLILIVGPFMYFAKKRSAKANDSGATTSDESQAALKPEQPQAINVSANELSNSTPNQNTTSPPRPQSSLPAPQAVTSYSPLKFNGRDSTAGIATPPGPLYSTQNAPAHVGDYNSNYEQNYHPTPPTTQTPNNGGIGHSGNFNYSPPSPYNPGLVFQHQPLPIQVIHPGSVLNHYEPNANATAAIALPVIPLPQSRMHAIAAFKPNDQTQIELTFNDTVIFESEYAPGWATVYNERTGLRGVVPLNYLR